MYLEANITSKMILEESGNFKKILGRFKTIAEDFGNFGRFSVLFKDYF